VPAAQSAHGIVELGLYLPTAHRVHVVAPGDASVLVTLPALHVMQVALPAIGWYVPAAQSAHGIVELELYLPTAHRVHVVALGDASVLVTLPALHVMQVALPAIGWYVPAAQSAHGIVELGLYLPTAHRVHVVALGDASVLVTLPALHVMQVALPAIGWYVPAAQSAHGIVEFGLYLPTAHRVHVVAPGDASVLVTLPALHVMQVALPAIG
jgi:hypothetical protein